jgi:anti-anti-sigma factor
VSPPGRFTSSAHHGTFIVVDHPDVLDVALRGEFDLSSTDASQKVIEHVGELLGSTPHPVRVDLSDVSFFDAAGIRFLLQIERLAELASTTSLVVNPSPDIRRLLEIVGLQRMLKEP